MSEASPGARLVGAASLVRQGAVLADVGTDHGYLPLFLFRTGVIGRAVLSDVNEGPLANAKSAVRAAGLTDKVTFVLTDGAKALAGMGITDYAICGMGGELIARIISEAKQLFDPSVSLILQPMTKQEHLRRFLWENGFEIRKEVFALEGNKPYVTLLASFTGQKTEAGEVEALFGESLTLPDDPCARAFAARKIAALQKRKKGLLVSGLPTGKEDAVLAALPAFLKTSEKEISHDSQ